MYFQFDTDNLGIVHFSLTTEERGIKFHPYGADITLHNPGDRNQHGRIDASEDRETWVRCKCHIRREDGGRAKRYPYLYLIRDHPASYFRVVWTGKDALTGETTTHVLYFSLIEWRNGHPNIHRITDAPAYLGPF